MTPFSQLGLSDPLLRITKELGFQTPTPIQAKAIPRLLGESRDFIGLAQTGTGKTAAFVLPLLDRIDPTNSTTQALIMAPTRELGQQISEQLSLFSKYLPEIKSLVVYGGANINQQIKALEKVRRHVIIATPGRLIDLIKRKKIDLSALKHVILDEADEMLTMGFKEDIDTILSYTPKEKNTWLFSATMSNEVNQIVTNYMDNPIDIRLSKKNEVNANIEHCYTIITRANKTEALVRFLDVYPDMRGVVFCRTRQDTQNLSDALSKRGYKADAINGDLTQERRDRVMKRFKNHELQVLIATDVAARGIDVNDISHVIHFTLPDDLAYYTHRSGRTARAGKEGVSIAFINGREKHRIHKIEQRLQIKFNQLLIPKSEEIREIRVSRWCHQILEKKTRGKLDPQLLQQANLLFGNLSKEELTAKILMYELERIQISKGGDLNQDQEQTKPGKRRNNRKGTKSRKRQERKPKTKFKRRKGKKKPRS